MARTSLMQSPENVQGIPPPSQVPTSITTWGGLAASKMDSVSNRLSSAFN